MADAPLPSGYALKTDDAPLPAGYTLKADDPGAKEPRTFWDSVGDAGKALWERTGQPMVDASQFFSADPAAHQKAVDTIQGMVNGVRDIPLTMQRELAETGRAVVHGHPADAAYHAAGAVPMLGPASQEVASDFDNGDYAKGFGHGAALLAPFVAPETIASLKAVAAKAAPAVSRVGADAAAGLYKTALKPRIDTPAADVRAMAQTGLENDLPVSEAGAAKLSKLVQDHQAVINPALQDAGRRGVTVDPGAVTGRLADVEQRVATQVNPESDLAAVKKSGSEFLRTQGATEGKPAVAPKEVGYRNGAPVMDAGTPAVPPGRAQPMAPDYAQAVKQGTYAKIKTEYGDMSSAQYESQKALARGIKEELETQIPELKAPLGAQGKLLDLQPVLEHSVNKMSNSGALGPVAGMALGAAAHGVEGGLVGGGLGVMAKVLADPALRSRLAITIYKAAQTNPAKFGAPSMVTAAARVAGYGAALDKAIAPSAADLATHYAARNPDSPATSEEIHAAAGVALGRHLATPAQ